MSMSDSLNSVRTNQCFSTNELLSYKLVLVAPRVHARLDTTICKYCVIFKLGSRGLTPGRVLP
jgi:hypothetical protein